MKRRRDGPLCCPSELDFHSIWKEMAHEISKLNLKNKKKQTTKKKSRNESSFPFVRRRQFCFRVVHCPLSFMGLHATSSDQRLLKMKPAKKPNKPNKNKNKKKKREREREREKERKRENTRVLLGFCWRRQRRRLSFSSFILVLLRETIT